MRRALFLAPVLSALLWACGDAASRAQSVRRELAAADVFVVAVDSVAAGHTTPYGYERDTTPFLDRLAGESVVFQDATAASPSGYASYASLVLGEALDAHGVALPGQRLPDDLSTLPERFRQAGYRTFGLSTHPAASAEAGFDRGFGRFVHASRAGDGRLPPEVVELLEEALDVGAPTFTLVHLTLLAPPRVAVAAAASELLGYLPEDELGLFSALAAANRTARDAETVLALLDQYDACLRGLDRELERILQPILRHEHTILVLIGTRGQAFGQHGRFGAGSDVHQEQVRVPLLLRLPDGWQGGKRILSPVATYELLPTLADLLGVDAASRTSTPWTPLFSDDWLERAWPVVSRTARPKPQYAARRDHFKLVTKPGSKALYHLEKDPREAASGSTQRPEILSDLDRELKRFKSRVGRSSPAERVELEPESVTALVSMGYAEGELRSD